MPAIGAVNPNIYVSIKQSMGYKIDSTFKQVPSYKTSTGVEAQIQALVYNDLQQISSLNIQGIKKAIYLNGEWEGLVRKDHKGGDLIIFPDGTTWLAVLVLENWNVTAGWTKLCVVQQID